MPGSGRWDLAGVVGEVHSVLSSSAHHFGLKVGRYREAPSVYDIHTVNLQSPAVFPPTSECFSHMPGASVFSGCLPKIATRTYVRRPASLGRRESALTRVLKRKQGLRMTRDALYGLKIKQASAANRHLLRCQTGATRTGVVCLFLALLVASPVPCLALCCPLRQIRTFVLRGG